MHFVIVTKCKKGNFPNSTKNVKFKYVLVTLPYRILELRYGAGDWHKIQYMLGGERGGQCSLYL